MMLDVLPVNLTLELLLASPLLALEWLRLAARACRGVVRRPRLDSPL